MPNKKEDLIVDDLFKETIEEEEFLYSNSGELKKGSKRGVLFGALLGALVASVVFSMTSILVRGSIFSIPIANKQAFTASADPKALPDGVFNQKLKHIKKLIDSNFIFDYKDSSIQDGILKGMLEALDDPYSQYYTADEFKAAMEQYDGAYSGIGAVISLSKDGKTASINSVYPNSPAEKAGMLAGDIIKEIDGKEIKIGMKLEEIVKLIKGPKGSKVEITVKREGSKKEITLTAIRDEIKVQTVYDDIFEKNIGYLRVIEFSGNTSAEFRKAYHALEKKGAKYMIVDLRDNPGGSFSTVCEMLDGFLSDGTIVYTEDKQGNREYVEADNKVEYKLKMVVLVNGNSASASEIFSGAVKDRGLGTLVGETTYGKGIVQNTIPLSDGTAIKLTISRYYTASGKEIHQKGIEPDIKIIYRQPKIVKDKKYTYKDDNQILRAIKVLKEK